MAKHRRSRKPRKSRRRKSSKQRGGSMLNYLLPFALWKVKNMVGKRTKKSKTRKYK